MEGDFPEQNWLGRKLQVGEVELDVAMPSPRCVMATRDFADLPTDRQVLRTIVEHAGQNIGVYANVLRPGMLNAATPITLI